MKLLFALLSLLPVLSFLHCDGNAGDCPGKGLEPTLVCITGSCDPNVCKGNRIQTGFSLEGTLRNSNGSALKGITVQMENFPLIQVKTDDQGKFRLPSSDTAYSFCSEKIYALQFINENGQFHSSGNMRFKVRPEKIFLDVEGKF